MKHSQLPLIRLLPIILHYSLLLNEYRSDRTIQGSSTNSILLFNNNVRNVIIDGSNNGTNSRDLKYYYTNTAVAAVVRMIGSDAAQGVRNVTLKNTIIKGGANTTAIGVLVGGTILSSASNGLVAEHHNRKQPGIQYDFGVALSGNSITDRIRNISVINNYFGISVDSTTVRNRQAAIFTTKLILV